MNQRVLALAAALSFGTIAAVADAVQKGAASAPNPAADLFGPDTLRTVHLEIPESNWDAMRPTRGGMFFGAPPAPPQARSGDEDRPPPGPPRGLFGFDFAYVKGDLECDGKKWHDVGVRFKGNSSYAMVGQSLKRPFKIDFDHFVEGQEFHGLKMINLNNNAFDPTQMRESLGYFVFRAAGVPAPRTGFIDLYLTVPGKHDREFLGLYTIIEQVDRTFLKNHFRNPKGMLLKPERIQNVPYLGNDWKVYEDTYRPQKQPDQKAKERLFEFTRLVNFADDAEFNDAIGQFMDVDEFLRFLAASTAMVNIDSFFGLGHNYYLYLNPNDNRFVFIPWDLNNTFGGFPMGGSSEQQMEWSIKKPYVGGNRLTERVLAVPENDAGYRKHLRALTAAGFHAEKLLAEMDRMQDAIQKVLDVESQKQQPAAGPGPGGGGPFGKPADLTEFVTRRAESLIAQLDGQSEGKDLGGGFFGFGQQRGGGSNPLAKPILETADEDEDGNLSREEAATALKRLFDECDAEHKGVLDEKSLAEGIARLMPRPRGAGFGPPGGGNSSGFGAGVHWAGFLFYKAGAKNNRLTVDELLALGAKRFRDADENSDGLLDEKELSGGLNAVPPAPFLFAPPAAAARQAPAAPNRPAAGGNP